LRRKRPYFENLDSADNIEGEIESVVKEEAFRLLERAIESLPNQTREVMRCSMKGLSIQEIADELNVSVNTIKTLKSRAYKVLKEAYGDTFMLLLLSFLSNG
jgi:RNA polymerase sigma-70 factor (ECF subfamily)